MHLLPTTRSRSRLALLITLVLSSLPLNGQTPDLTGAGIAAATLSPANYTFPTTALGNTSAPRTFTLTNNQTTPLTISSITVGSNFSFAPGTCSGSLAAKQSCTLTVTFVPSAARLIGTVKGTLTITDDAAGSPQSSNLTATTKLPVRLSATALAFGTIKLGVTSTAKNVTLTNQQNVPLTLNAISLAGADATEFSQSNNCPATPLSLAPAGSCTIAVKFSPTNGGLRTASLTINNSAVTSPLATSLSGTGTAVLSSVTVTPTSPSVSVGGKQQFTATGHYNDGTSQDMTSTAVWSSSSTAVASVSNTGLSSAIKVGVSTIKATAAGVSGSTTLTVTGVVLVSISVTPANVTIAQGTIQQYQATGTFSNGTTQDLTSSASWMSAAPAIATISASGFANAVGQGNSTISATVGSVTGSTSLTVTVASLVSIAVFPANVSFAKGTTQQFKAIGAYTDGSTQDLTGSVNWAATPASIATVSNAAGSAGLASAVDVGQGNVTATSGAVSGSTGLTVTPATLDSIIVTPAIPSVPLGTTQQFTATAMFTDGTTQDMTAGVTWTSSNGAIASISNATGTQGLAASQSTGSTTIQASAGAITGQTTLTVTAAALVSIAVKPAAPSLALGSTQQFVATGTFTDSTSRDLSASVGWSSSTVAVATVSSSGLATTASLGSTTIQAVSGAINGSTTLTVTPAILVSIAITPHSATVPLGTTQQFTATGTFSDNSQQDLTSTGYWTSSDATIATISDAAGSQGLASTVATGNVTISVASAGVTATAPLTVSPAVLISMQISPQYTSIALGTSQQFSASGTYSDGSTRDITTIAVWYSSAPYVAVVSNNSGAQGLATSARRGVTFIFASVGSVTQSTALTVTPAVVTSLTISPQNVSLPRGSRQLCQVNLQYSDGTTVDVTSQSALSSSNAAVATVDQSCHLVAVSIGTATITATYSSLTASSSVTVTPPVLSFLGISPAYASITPGQTVQYAAIGTYTDNSTADLTSQSSWTSTTPTVAMINSSGLASGIAPGRTGIRASFNGTLSNTSQLAVTSAPLVSISVTPANASLATGKTQQFTATGTYSDSSTQDLTASVTWSSSNIGAATVSASGLATGVAVGSATIAAANGSISSNAAMLTVYMPGFTPTGSMSQARTFPNAILLPNGQVLVAGGSSPDGNFLATAELYDPGTGTFTSTGSMSYARYSLTATLLPNGKVLVVGGVDPFANFIAPAELYDPGTGTFTSTGSMSAARSGHTATLLPNGQVLIAGGFNLNINLQTTAELYDPGTGTFTPTGSMSSARYGHSATLLANGTVLLAGGDSGNTPHPQQLAKAELYDPGTGTFTLTGSMSSARVTHTATLLSTGQVLVSGGDSGILNLATAELYDPGKGTFTPTGSMSSARNYYTATLLRNGTVLVVGGAPVDTVSVSLATAQLYDPGTGTFTPTGSLNFARSFHAATLLQNGQVLVVGGAPNNGCCSAVLASELYVP